MDAYDKCTNLGKKNLADSTAIYGRGREPSRTLTYSSKSHRLHCRLVQGCWSRNTADLFVSNFCSV